MGEERREEEAATTHVNVHAKEVNKGGNMRKVNRVCCRELGTMMPKEEVVEVERAKGKRGGEKATTK